MKARYLADRVRATQSECRAKVHVCAAQSMDLGDCAHYQQKLGRIVPSCLGHPSLSGGRHITYSMSELAREMRPRGKACPPSEKVI